MLPVWHAKAAKERAASLRKLFDFMMANQNDLAAIMTSEQGKPLTEDKGEIAHAARFIEWFGEEGKRVYGDTIPAFGADKREEEAIQLANDTEFGLATYFYGREGSKYGIEDYLEIKYPCMGGI